jgi:hypothetical protein
MTAITVRYGADIVVVCPRSGIHNIHIVKWSSVFVKCLRSLLVESQLAFSDFRIRNQMELLTFLTAGPP